MDTVREGGRGVEKLSCAKWVAGEESRHREPSLALCDDLEGWRVRGGVGISRDRRWMHNYG